MVYASTKGWLLVEIIDYDIIVSYSGTMGAIPGELLPLSILSQLIIVVCVHQYISDQSETAIVMTIYAAIHEDLSQGSIYKGLYCVLWYCGIPVLMMENV